MRLKVYCLMNIRHKNKYEKNVHVFNVCVGMHSCLCEFACVCGLCLLVSECVCVWRRSVF